MKVRRDATTLEMLAEALARSGRLREARTAIREALQSGVRSAAIYARAAEIERTQGDVARASLYEELARAAGGAM